MSGYSPQIRQEMKQQQKLILSPQMQQALHLLQLPIQDLTQLLEEELALNPLLELPEEDAFDNEYTYDFENQKSFADDDKQTVIENRTAYERSLYAQLQEQVSDFVKTEEEKEILYILIGYLDRDGFLRTPLEEIADWENLPLEVIEKGLKTIQSFEPIGVGARSLKESLLIQLKLLGKENTLAYEIIYKHYEDMLNNRIPLIAKSQKCSYEQINQVIEKEIARLDLRPGANAPEGHYSTQSSQLIADVIVRIQDQKIDIEINEGRSFHLRLNKIYLQMLENPEMDMESKNYLVERLQSGKHLMRNLYERHQTLYRLTEVLIEKQFSFFYEPRGQLNPLTMKEIALELSLHESTIARAVAGKNLAHPKGITPLRQFFTNSYTTEKGEAISSNSVKDYLRKILEKEDRARPLSDEAISQMIKKEGIECARRTVAKYRQELGVGNAKQRKRHSSNTTKSLS